MYLFNTWAQFSKTSTQQSLETSPVPLKSGSSPSKIHTFLLKLYLFYFNVFENVKTVPETSSSGLVATGCRGDGNRL